VNGSTLRLSTITKYNERECGIVDTNSSSSDNGFDPGSDPGTDSGFGDNTDPGFDSGLPVGGIVAGLADSLGIPEDQARCLVEKLDFTSGTEPDITSMMSSFADCGIDPLTLGSGG